MQLAQRGLTALCRSVNGALPACQMLALTDPTQPVPPPAGALGAKPRAMGMDVYVFTQQGNASIPAIFNNIINDLAALPPPFPQLPVPSLAPIALNAVPNQVGFRSRSSLLCLAMWLHWHCLSNIWHMPHRCMQRTATVCAYTSPGDHTHILLPTAMCTCWLCLQVMQHTF